MLHIKYLFLMYLHEYEAKSFSTFCSCTAFSLARKLFMSLSACEESRPSMSIPQRRRFHTGDVNFSFSLNYLDFSRASPCPKTVPFLMANDVRAPGQGNPPRKNSLEACAWRPSTSFDVEQSPHPLPPHPLRSRKD